MNDMPEVKTVSSSEEDYLIDALMLAFVTNPLIRFSRRPLLHLLAVE